MCRPARGVPVGVLRVGRPQGGHRVPARAGGAELTGRSASSTPTPDGVNGAPRITADLREDGEVVSQQDGRQAHARPTGLRGISPRPVAAGDHDLPDQVPHTIPDLVGRVFDRGRAQRGLDLRHHLSGHRSGLAVPVRRPRRLLPPRARLRLLRHLHTDVVETALRRAVTFRDAARPHRRGDLPRRPGLSVHHRPAGRRRRRARVRLSVGRTGVCWDNAQIESFWSTLKTEFYHRHGSRPGPRRSTPSAPGSTPSTTAAGATVPSARSLR